MYRSRMTGRFLPALAPVAAKSKIAPFSPFSPPVPGRVVAGVEALGLPVVQVAVLDPGGLGDVQSRDGLLRLHAPQEGERPVQRADVRVAGDDGEPVPALGDRPDEVAVVADGRQIPGGDVPPYGPRAVPGAHDHRAVGDPVTRARPHRHRPAQQPAEASDQFRPWPPPEWSPPASRPIPAPCSGPACGGTPCSGRRSPR